MKLGSFHVDHQTVIAIQHNNQWIVLNSLLKNHQENRQENSIDDYQDLLAVLDQWPQLLPDITTALEQDHGQTLPDSATPVLGFAPASLRDFMLSEQHAINSARGMVKQFMPAISKLVSLYEKTGNIFPALKPKPIWYKQPIYYFSNHLNLVTDGDNVPYPSHTHALDYEIELAFVITKPLFNASEIEAKNAIGGFMILNDYSARDIQVKEMRSGFGPQNSKHFSNGLSHTITTADDILPHTLSNSTTPPLTAEVKINGIPVSNTDTKDMRFDPVQLLVQLSKSTALHPGEVFGLGTMPNGCALENKHWLKVGDTIELSIEKIGSLTNRIIDTQFSKAVTP